MATEPKKIIIDTDPGIDDAMAIFLALRSLDVEVIGLTAIYGNVYTTLATRNVLHLKGLIYQWLKGTYSDPLSLKVQNFALLILSMALMDLATKFSLHQKESHLNSQRLIFLLSEQANLYPRKVLGTTNKYCTEAKTNTLTHTTEKREKKKKKSRVRGVILDESVLISEHQTQNANDSSFQLPPGASYLLRKLRHSDIRTGISYEPSVLPDKMSVLKKMATEYLCDDFLLDATIDGGVNEITQAWGDIGGIVMYVVSNNKDSFCKPSDNWLITVVGVGATGNNAMIVGYVMKPSREEDFAKRGAFPMCPTPSGLIFLPLIFEIPLASQLQKVAVVLHKATDEIISIELGSSSESSNRITYTLGMQELQRFLEHRSDFFAIDSLNNVYPVLDRLKIQLLLLGLQDRKAEGQRTIKGAHFFKVNDFNNPDLAQRMSDTKLSLPCIVKPQVACGVADGHSVAIVFGIKDFKNLSVPLPAIVQEYVNHSSTLFKFYVLGENVFHTVKKSTPNSIILMKSYERNGLRPITFDSLKSLPIDTENHHSGKVNDHDLGLVKNAAKWLAKTLDLTVFGFDVVIQDVAIPAFWDAIKKKFESKKMNRATTTPSS